MKILILIISGIFSGILGSLGVGGGGVLIVFLTFFLSFQREVAAFTNLLFFVPIALFSTIIYAKRKQIDFKKVLYLVPTGLIGSAIGVYLTNIIETDILSKYVEKFLSTNNNIKKGIDIDFLTENGF